MVICVCKSLSKSKLIKIISTKKYDFDKLSKKTGACTDCGCCRKSIQNLFLEISKNSIDKTKET